MSLIVRRAAPEDYDGIASLVVEGLGYKTLDRAVFMERMERIRKDERHDTFVACRGDEIVGFIGVCTEFTYEIDEFLWIQAIAVSPFHRHRGVGGALVAEAERCAKERGVRTIKANCAIWRKDAHKFYEDTGFERKSYCFFKYL